MTRSDRRTASWISSEVARRSNLCGMSEESIFMRGLLRDGSAAHQPPAMSRATFGHSNSFGNPLMAVFGKLNHWMRTTLLEENGQPWGTGGARIYQRENKTRGS